MDFTVEQRGNTRFMYVLPFSKNKALVEYTLFSAEPLEKKEYEDEIVSYLKEMTLKPYKVIQMESGNIPMCCYPLWKKTTSKIMPIGMAGGWTKASTGYTFKSSQEKAKALALFLTQEKDGESLAKYILTLFENVELREKFSTLGRRRIETEFNLKLNAAKLEEIYDNTGT